MNENIIIPSNAYKNIVISKEMIEENLNRVKEDKSLTMPLVILGDKFKERYYKRNLTIKQLKRKWKRLKQYRKRPYVRENNKRYLKQYHQRPDVKKKEKQYHKQYYQENRESILKRLKNIRNKTDKLLDIK